jgi:hypothetical protein
VCRSVKREEVCKSKVLGRKFVPEEKEVTGIIISVIEFRSSPSDRDEGWKEGWGGRKGSQVKHVPLEAVPVLKTVGTTVSAGILDRRTDVKLNIKFTFPYPVAF